MKFWKGVQATYNKKFSFSDVLKNVACFCTNIYFMADKM